jgi:acetyltransferase
MLDWAVAEGIGFSCLVSTGNALDVDFGDLIDYLGMHPPTRSIILYLQSIRRARSFLSAARAFARAKPIVAYKAGRFAQSARVAAFHTGAMAAEDAVYDAAFTRAGIVRVAELDDVFDVAELLASHRLPGGARLAIVTNAGGPGVIAADALLARGGVLAELSERTRESLRESLPPHWLGDNPVDLQDSAPPERFAAATQMILADRGVDALLVIFAPQAVTDPAETARAVASVAVKSIKPVLAAWMGGNQVREGTRILNAAGLPAHPTPEQAVRAFMHLVSYAQNLKTLYETPRNIPVSFSLNRVRLRRRLDRLLPGERTLLTERQSKALLAAYQIPVCRAYAAASPEQAVRIARRIGYPVVLKVVSPQIAHKSDVGGVALKLGNDDHVRRAFRRIVADVRQLRPDAHIEGLTVQKMVAAENGLEMILGAKKDPTFGAVIMVGMGGVAAGVLQDHALGLPPLNERLALHMLESLRAWPLLQGYRGRPGVKLERLVEIMIRFSYLLADYPEIWELDINPLLVTPEGAVALDAAAILDSSYAAEPAGSYSHLAICPYPEDCLREVRLEDGTAVRLRPIKPEDEPLWHELHANASPDSLRFRFRTVIKHTTHELATRHCFIDYEREMTLVAELEREGRTRLIGVGGFSTDADNVSAEYAGMVEDAWQGKGLGGELLDECMAIARNRGVRRLYAETTPNNTRMLSVFRTRGFQMKQDISEDVVYAEKHLDPYEPANS